MPLNSNYNYHTESVNGHVLSVFLLSSCYLLCDIIGENEIAQRKRIISPQQYCDGFLFILLSYKS